MKTVALVASLALHLGALSVIPASDAHESVAARNAIEKARSSEDSCKCDLEMSADCSSVFESRAVR